MCRPSEDGVPRPVYLTLKSADVCHSFWVPRLAGKTDLIPGRTNHLWFQTNQQGLFLGQCAEYLRHAARHMLLRVNVDSPAAFQGWLDDQRSRPRTIRPPARVATSFLSQSCVNCHRVRGTVAAGTYAPDLTHLMSRQTLAVGDGPQHARSTAEVGGRPQQVKSGCLMPAFGLSESQMDRIVGYLTTLK